MSGGFHISPEHLSSSGGKLADFGAKLAEGGTKLESAGQNLVNAAKADQSGFGAVLTKALGRGTEITGKVFAEGGGWAQRAGKNLHSNGQNHRANDDEHARVFRGLSSADKATHHPKAGGGPAGSRGGSGAGPAHSGSTAPSSTAPTTIAGHNTAPKANATPTRDRPTCGDPIDLSTGRMSLTQVDVELAGALPLVLSRTHLSSYRLGRSFGRSWASTVDQRVEVADDSVHFAVADGTLLVYPVPADGAAVLPVEGPRWPLVRTDEGYAIAQPSTDQVWHFAGTGLIAAIHDGNGHRIDIDRDAAGVPTELRHSGGYRVGVTTERGRITALRLLGDDHSAGGETQDLDLVRYRYDDADNLVEVLNSSGLPLRFEYDDAGRIVRWDDRNAMWYRYVYDERDRCTRAWGAGDYLTYAFGYRDDAAGRVTTATNSLGHTSTYQLDENYRVVAETDPLGNVTRSAWDRHGELRERTDPLGRTTRYEYDEAGNATLVTRPDGAQTVVEFDARSRPVTTVEPDGAVWRREYRPADGLLAALVDPTGARTTYDYDSRGHLTAVADAVGNTTRFEIDPVGLPAAVTDPLGGTTRYRYDRFGRLTSVTDPVGGVTTMSWTIEGKPLRRTLPDGTVQRWVYDGEGNLRETVDPQGNVTRTEVAHFDLPVAEVRPDGSRLRFGYDTELRLVSVTNEQGLVWRYEYDAAGNMVAETDFNGRARRYRHDSAGQLVEHTDGTGQTTLYRYDPTGRLVRREAGDEVSAFDYDPAGRILLARNADAEVAFSYDPLGRPLTEAVNGRVVTSAYDVLGRRVLRRTPSGAESGWEYDANSQPVALHTAGRTIRFGYDAAGREVDRQLGAGVRLTHAWDANNRLTAQAVLAGGPAPRTMQRRDYRYRPDGFLAAVEDQLAGPRGYDLDPTGRITGVRGAGWAERYDYDPAGNITRADWPGTADSDGVGEREYAGTLIRRAGGVRYEHDAEGRIVLRQRKTLSSAARSWHYTWNADDRLVGVRTPDGQRWRYRYDVFGRRIAKQRLAPDGVGVLEQTEFAWDGNELIEQVYNGVQATVWDWEPGSYRAVSQRERSALRDVPAQWIDQRFYAIVTDLVGTPTELVDAEGNLAALGRHTLWGAQVGGGAYTPLRFPGQYHDPETGLHYNLQRYYDPVTGRYASTDPLGLQPSPNPQAYVPNPTNWIDPTGLAPTDCAGKTTTVYRVEVPPKIGPDGRVVRGKEGNILLNIDQQGNATVPKNKMLYLNFGSAQRANEYLQKRFDQGAEGAHIKSFQVPTSYVDGIRQQAVSEADIRTIDPGKTRPVIADPTKADDQFGLRPHHLDALRGAIIPGSGKRWDGFVPEGQ